MRTIRSAICASLVMALQTTNASAQLSRSSSVDWLASAGSETEQYFRTLELLGLSATAQWSVRPFSSAQLARLAPTDSGHPWAHEIQARARPAVWARPVAVEVSATFNSRFPYGFNDGPIWAGRGLTVAVAAGVQGKVGPLQFVLAPQFFRAQNSEVPLAPNGMTGTLVYADARNPTFIDLPQRFGAGPYQRLDPGQSTISIDAGPVAIGVSTANEAWGPAIENPYLLGTNAAGFAHVFAGTNHPVSLGPITFGGRVLAGRLEQSDYSATSYAGRRRSIAAAIAVLGFDGIPGLEIGVGRLFEDVYPDSGVGLADILRPLVEAILKSQKTSIENEHGNDAANQLASLFIRWMFPRSGVEIYGELGREDHSYDSRDLLVEPDHSLAYVIGLQRAWQRSAEQIFALRVEVLNAASTHLNQVRLQGPPYIHTVITQGHTQLGQLIGAPGGYGGGASVVEATWLSRSGRRSVAWRRIVREPTTDPASAGDVVQAATAEWLLFRPRVDIKPQVVVAYNLNRDGSGDALNLRLSLSGYLHW